MKSTEFRGRMISMQKIIGILLSLAVLGSFSSCGLRSWRGLGGISALGGASSEARGARLASQGFHSIRGQSLGMAPLGSLSDPLPRRMSLRESAQTLSQEGAPVWQEAYADIQTMSMNSISPSGPGDTYDTKAFREEVPRHKRPVRWFLNQTILNYEYNPWDMWIPENLRPLGDPQAEIFRDLAILEYFEAAIRTKHLEVWSSMDFDSSHMALVKGLYAKYGINPGVQMTEKLISFLEETSYSPKYSFEALRAFCKTLERDLLQKTPEMERLKLQKLREVLGPSASQTPAP